MSGLSLYLDDQVHFNRDSLVVENGGRPAELADGFNHAGIDGLREGLNDMDALRAAGLVETELEDDAIGVGESGGQLRGSDADFRAFLI